MNRTISTLFLILLLCLSFTVTSAAENPFAAQKGIEVRSGSPGIVHKMLARLSLIQKKIKQDIVHTVRSFKESKKLSTFFILFFSTLLYGVVHSAGPGHGKVFALGYMMTRKAKLGECLLFGNAIALAHGLSGVVLVLLLRFIIQKTTSGVLADTNHITQIISYGIITLMGIVLIVRLVIGDRRRREGRKIYSTESTGSNAGKIAAALAIGMVPCPGVVLIMLFAISFEVLWLGLVLALAMTVGMAITISAVVVIGTTGKTMIIKALNKRYRSAAIIERTIEYTAAILITSMGILFLATTLYTAS